MEKLQSWYLMAKLQNIGVQRNACTAKKVILRGNNRACQTKGQKIATC